ncbi:MAG: hypothetical protein AAGG07_06575 [Planctomycetota bacterium]
MKKLLAIAAIAAAAGSASATTWTFESTSLSGNRSAGNFDRVFASYNDTTNRFVWEVTMSERNGQLADGFTLAINGGPNPKGHAGEMALLYMDASRGDSDVRLTAYNYNGRNAFDSYVDGDKAAGIQAPDRIWNNMAAQANRDGGEISATTSGTTRTFRIDIDASDLVLHNPVYGTAADWTGVAFGERMGIWFHTYSGLNTSYAANGDLESWTRNAEGWIDKSNLLTDPIIPAPTAAAMGLAGLGLAAGRRRR